MKTAFGSFIIAAAICADECTGFQQTTSNGVTSHHDRGENTRSSRTFVSTAAASPSVSIQRNCGAAQQRPAFASTAQRTKATTSRTTPTRLFSTSSSSSSTSPKLDVDAMGKYGGAIAIQLSIIFALFSGLDWLVAKFHIQQQIPFAANCALFYVFALKSRLFNPLANTRPKPATLEIPDDNQDPKTATTTTTTIRPSWTPPGFIFPIMWLLIIGPIRAVTSAMIYASTGSYACWAIMSLMLHLSIGDVWNTINNVERRYGASVIGVLLVWLTKAHAAYQYLQVNEMAGKILAVTLVWLTIASALITRTWQLNPDAATGKPEPLYPVTGKVKTRYIWFQK